MRTYLLTKVLCLTMLCFLVVPVAVANLGYIAPSPTTIFEDDYAD